MDPITAFLLGAVFLGFPLGIATDRVVIPILAHQLAGHLRSHVRIR